MRSLWLLLLLLAYGCSRTFEEPNLPDTTPPAPPSALKVYFAGDGMVILVWDKNREPDLAKYKIYRTTDTTSNFAQIGETTYTDFTDSELDYDSTYFYYVTAVDISENESQPSNIVSAKPRNIYPPVQPYGLIAYAHNDPEGIYVELSWLKNPDGDIKGYKIYRDIVENFTPSSENFLAFSIKNFLKDTMNLQPKKRYFYKITAVDKGDLESRPSYTDGDIILEKPELIEPKNNAFVSFNPVLSWKKVDSASGYILIVSTSRYGNEIWKKIISSGNLPDTIRITYLGPSLYEGRSYYWKVATFTKNENVLNSISETRTFIISR